MVVMKKKTNEEFVSEVFQLVGDSFVPLTKYQGSKIKVAFYHADCGNMFYMTPNSFLRGQRCPKCGVIIRTIKQTLTPSQFKKRIDKINQGRYVILSRYVKCDDKLDVKCLKCNREFHPTGHNLLAGVGCPFCNHAVKLPKNEFNKRVREKNNGQFRFLDSYIDTDTKIRCQCKLCNFIWYITPHSFYHLKGCPMCQTNKAYTLSEFKRKLYLKRGSDYVLDDEYRSGEELVFRHTKCNHTFSAYPVSMLAGTRSCPFCNKSNGETIIISLLNSFNIDYITQYKFNSCKYKRKLPFDFYLPQLRVAIEYDGSQHFEVNHFGRTTELFKIAKLRDNIKTWYCQSHGIYLIRIPYKAKTKEQIKQYLYCLK